MKPTTHIVPQCLLFSYLILKLMNQVLNGRIWAWCVKTKTRIPLSLIASMLFVHFFFSSQSHMATCRGCSDLDMASSKEWPLCTRIVTEYIRISGKRKNIIPIIGWAASALGKRYHYVGTHPKSGEKVIEGARLHQAPTCTNLTQRSNPKFFPHLPSSLMKCLCWISKIWYSSWSMKHIPIKIPRNITLNIIFHCPHCFHEVHKTVRQQRCTTSSGYQPHFPRAAEEWQAERNVNSASGNCLGINLTSFRRLLSWWMDWLVVQISMTREMHPGMGSETW